ncbi:hypothetical protein PR002_g16842 [Phytophthora rubi]|nr:hypothetical protein PR002_g16842 [Phytophthora rubi]
MEDKSTGGRGAPSPLRYRAGDANQKPRVAGLRAKTKTTSKKRTAEQASATEQAPPKKCAGASSAAIAPTATRVGSTKASASGKKPFTAATATSTAAPKIIASALDTTQRKGDVCHAEATTADGHAVAGDARTDEEHQVLQSFAHVHAERQHSGQQKRELLDLDIETHCKIKQNEEPVRICYAYLLKSWSNPPKTTVLYGINRSNFSEHREITPGQK